MKSLKDVKAQLLAKPAVRQAYDAQAPEFALALERIAARTQACLTQGEVAARMGTTQSVVARIESGRGTPSMRAVQRFASAVRARAVVRMEPLTAVCPLLQRRLSVGTVDSFQGQEHDIIAITLYVQQPPRRDRLSV
jgi:transcriptional regulator with XRE-family HTH domain